MKKILLTFVLAAIAVASFAQITKQKTIDSGSSGPYKAIAVEEKTLTDFVIYRPSQLKQTVEKAGLLPIIVWANGACMNTSIGHERFLSEIASHGYVIVAIGAMELVPNEHAQQQTPDDELLKALDWITQQAKNEESEYYKMVNLDKIAAAGMSCGGAQAFRVAGDERVKTYMICNAGMGDMTMAGASTRSLAKLNGEIIYIIGGESDIAYQNAILDFDRIDNVPVVFANHKSAGHSGTYAAQFGGSFAQMAIDWLDWHFKNKDNSAIFLENDLSKYPDWTMKAKGF